MRALLDEGGEQMAGIEFAGLAPDDSRLAGELFEELAEAAGIEKGEEMEWLVDDRNTFILRRLKPRKPVAKGKTPLT